MPMWVFWFAVVLMLVGLVGILLPAFPGAPIIWVAAIVYVRCQILRSHSRPAPRWHSDAGQIAALAAVTIGWSLDAVPLAAVFAVGALGIFNAVGLNRPPPPAVVIGLQQMVFGLIVVAVTAVAVLAA